MKKLIILIIVIILVIVGYLLFFAKPANNQPDERSLHSDISGGFLYQVTVPNEWIKAAETSNSISWFTPEANRSDDGHLKQGAKFAITISQNPENLSISEWLERYSGDNPDSLISKELIQIANFNGEKYIYNDFGTQTPSRINIHIQTPDRLLGFVVFYSGADKNYNKQLTDLAASFIERNF